jgi:hypothetical protein
MDGDENARGGRENLDADLVSTNYLVLYSHVDDDRSFAHRDDSDEVCTTATMIEASHTDLMLKAMLQRR